MVRSTVAERGALKKMKTDRSPLRSWLSRAFFRSCGLAQAEVPASHGIKNGFWSYSVSLARGIFEALK